MEIVDRCKIYKSLRVFWVVWSPRNRNPCNPPMPVNIEDTKS